MTCPHFRLFKSCSPQLRDWLSQGTRRCTGWLRWRGSACRPRWDGQGPRWSPQQCSQRQASSSPVQVHNKKYQFLLVPFSAPLQVSQPLHLAITHSHSIRKHLDNGPPTPPHPTPPHQYSTHYTPHSLAQCVHYPIDSPTSGSQKGPPGAVGCGPQPCPPRQSGPPGWA